VNVFFNIEFIDFFILIVNIATLKWYWINWYWDQSWYWSLGAICCCNIHDIAILHLQYCNFWNVNSMFMCCMDIFFM